MNSLLTAETKLSVSASGEEIKDKHGFKSLVNQHPIACRASNVALAVLLHVALELMISVFGTETPAGCKDDDGMIQFRDIPTAPLGKVVHLLELCGLFDAVGHECNSFRSSSTE